MHFCTQCGNMYYTRLGGTTLNELIYYCRKCGHEDNSISSDPTNICVSKTEIKKKSASYHHIVNEYTKLDPTLPRLDNIPCPNPTCSSNISEQKGEEKAKNEVIYLRYDDANLKYVYVCANCDTVWKTAGN